jgi:uncharacterized protein YdaU (DUF1376 family)
MEEKRYRPVCRIIEKNKARVRFGLRIFFYFFVDGWNKK